MSPELITAISSLAIALLAAIPGILAYRNTRMKLITEREDTAVDAWREMMEPMRTRIRETERHIEALEDKARDQAVRIEQQKTLLENMEKQNEQLINGIRLLVAQLRANGHEPVWEPKYEA